MDRLNAPLVEKLSQVIPHSHNTRRRISRCGVRKFFLRMGVEDQDLRSSCRIVDLHAPPQEIIRIELIRTDHGGAVHCVKIAEQIIKIPELLYRHIDCGSHFCRRSLRLVRLSHQAAVFIDHIFIVCLALQYLSDRLLVLYGRLIRDMILDIAHQGHPRQRLFPDPCPDIRRRVLIQPGKPRHVHLFCTLQDPLLDRIVPLVCESPDSQIQKPAGQEYSGRCHPCPSCPVSFQSVHNHGSISFRTFF